MLNARVKNLDAILLTHEHKDHIAGMDDLRAFNHKSKAAIDIYAEERVQAAVRKNTPMSFLHENHYPGVPKMELHNIGNYNLTIKGDTFTPLGYFTTACQYLVCWIGNMATLLTPTISPKRQRQY